MRLCDFKDKQVINLCDCCVIGCVSDIIFNECTGKITDIIVPGPARLCGIFGRDSEYIIPWNHICQIGPDIILVKLTHEEAKAHKVIF
ncbi:PRC-barrel domain-containing protein [Candidatus Galacturonibacter soehngenii]|uniref:YlmC/YmxH family sporulation protein n=1 Tax=Candidatus Galacturonatibacter soehngenii TaxID=2307010 RepID=A0A7V7QLG7_9FIRM|nr:YlmC/YmxH family sporulation protein [Candidatus Galacturonibacter soehngenii]KAB1439331.1 YlmC/YmxH family sporulation protein [Candidatus Galacturonibacter soehngenii]MBA4687521.1 YlmC/YmxH family sporulation protein [Candidatus Galacturonibacter soehngenii]